MNKLIDAVSRLLDPAEREAVLGDLAESRESGARKFAGVMLASGIIRSNSDSTARTRFTMSMDVRPASRRSSAGAMVLFMERCVSNLCTTEMTRSAAELLLLSAMMPLS